MGDPRQKETGNTHQAVKRETFFFFNEKHKDQALVMKTETQGNSEQQGRLLIFQCPENSSSSLWREKQRKMHRLKIFADKYIISKIYFKAL